MELIIVSVIIVLYFVITLFKNKLTKILPIKVCSLCYAVSVTWISLLLMSLLFDLEVDPIFLGILMGGSIVGILYSLEEYYHNHDLQKFWLVRIGWLTLGSLSAYYLLIRNWDYLLLSSIALIFLMASSLLIRSIPNGGGNKNSTIAGLSKKLEDCCD